MRKPYLHRDSSEVDILLHKKYELKLCRRRLINNSLKLLNGNNSLESINEGISKINEMIYKVTNEINKIRCTENVISIENFVNYADKIYNKQGNLKC
ncbi:MAG: hypothetical protein KDC67_13815 [Ignavibacteriae bacterium]|nr:hypothetical protein [Ignavibacteriota bacterium]